jgi:hypothetical protein
LGQPRQPWASPADADAEADADTLPALPALPPAPDPSAEAAMWAALRDQLRALLEAGHNRRIQHLLYRVDVDERRAQALWRTTPPEALPDALADLIFARLRQIADSRRVHRFPVDPDEAW